MMQSSEDKNKSISVNIAVLTVSDTRTINNDKSGDYLVKSVKQEGHNCTERNIVTDDVGIILNILRKWITNKNIDTIIIDCRFSIPFLLFIYFDIILIL